jgi:hypothetical protein
VKFGFSERLEHRLRHGSHGDVHAFEREMTIVQEKLSTGEAPWLMFPEDITKIDHDGAHSPPNIAHLILQVRRAPWRVPKRDSTYRVAGSFERSPRLD